MMKYFLTGAAKGVADSMKRVATIMKGRPIPDGKRRAPEPARKDFGKRSNPKS
jgi:hypothetical protein